MRLGCRILKIPLKGVRKKVKGEEMQKEDETLWRVGNREG